ncbi:response regulator [Kineococcus sp. SYSU DK006]|uniref:response regulator n=1 Tax=Kineococcus sp. SYSU DK006 TaxID=3383127 RepID=UPI003D7C91FA
MSAAAPVRLLLADDDPLVRSALTMVFGALPDVELVGEAVDGEEAVQRTCELRPDVVLVDLRMPRCDGVEATTRITAGTAARVVVLTTFGDDASVLAAVRAGASGFLLKDTPPADLVAAVRRAAAGEPVLSPEVTRRLMARVAAQLPPAPSRGTLAAQALQSLSPREHQVALAIGRGLSNAEIAAELGVGTATVKAHATRVMAGLGVGNRVQVALAVHDAGLLPGAPG